MPGTCPTADLGEPSCSCIAQTSKAMSGRNGLEKWAVDPSCQSLWIASRVAYFERLAAAGFDVDFAVDLWEITGAEAFELPVADELFAAGFWAT